MTQTPKLNLKRVTRTDDKGKVIEIEDTINLELYDSQSALKEIVRINRLDAGQAVDNTQIILHTGMDVGEL